MHAFLRDDRGSCLMRFLLAPLVLLGIACYFFWSDIKRELPFMEPTAADFCNTFKSEGDKLHDKWAQQTKGDTEDEQLLGNITTVMGAPRDMANFFDELAENSPNEIHDDVEQQADAYRDLADTQANGGTDILGSLVKNLIRGSQNVQSEQRVNNYALEHCEPPVGRKGLSDSQLNGMRPMQTESNRSRSSSLFNDFDRAA